MRAVLFKDHYYPTAPIVELIRERYAHSKVEPLGGIALNNALGGFNAYAVEHAPQTRHQSRVDADGFRPPTTSARATTRSCWWRRRKCAVRPR